MKQTATPNVIAVGRQPNGRKQRGLHSPTLTTPYAPYNIKEEKKLHCILSVEFEMDLAEWTVFAGIPFVEPNQQK